MQLSNAIGLEQGILACAGAGGKTSLLLTLASELMVRRQPLLLTTTTKMFFHQVEAFAPLITADYVQGAEFVAQQAGQGQVAAWFAARTGEKVVGLEPDWLARLVAAMPYILVEADGAQQKLLKAPGLHEPVWPEATSLYVGVLNCHAIGKPCTVQYVHRLEHVLTLTGLAAGQLVRLQDVARLAGHPAGIFRGSSGRKVLVLNGWEQGMQDSIAALLTYLREFDQIGIERCVFTTGYASELRVHTVRMLD